jgi:hypothetical protein
MAAKLALELQQLHKKVKEAKTDCVRKHDKWGQNFRAPLLASCLQFSTAQEIANSNAVCTGWRLPQHLEDRLMKPLYVEDFTLLNSGHPKLAPRGEDTPWRVRYGRRQHVHNNVLTRTYRLVSHTHQNELIYAHNNHSQVQAIFYKYNAGTVTLSSLPEFADIKTGTLLSHADIDSDQDTIVCTKHGICVLYDVPSLQERERIYTTGPACYVRALRGDYLVMVNTVGPDRRCAVRSVSEKRQLWTMEIQAGEIRDYAIEATRHLLFTAQGESVFAADIRDGAFLAKYSLRDSNAWLYQPWDGLPEISIHDWGQHIVYFLRLTATNQFRLVRQLSVPPNFDVRMAGYGRLAWQNRWDRASFSVLDMQTEKEVVYDTSHGSEAFLNCQQVAGLFVLQTGCKIIDFTVGLS